MIFLRFLLTSSKISACRSEERNSRAAGKGKQGFYFHRKMKYSYQTIAVIIKFGLEQYINKKQRKILIEIFFFLDKEAKNLKVKYFIQKFWQR